ncbi:MAG: hypothetical protein WDZ94_03165 [Patescibacteria group bacterium]
MLLGPIIVIALRLLVPLYILKSPFWGTVISLVLDALDVVLLTFINLGDLENYHQIDKVLDMYYLALAAYATRNWQNRLAKRVAIGLFFYRLIGVVLFEFTGIRPLLLLFPNLFENFFLFYAGSLALFKKEYVPTKRSLTIALIVLLLLKLPQEYLLHYMQAQPWVWMQEYVF